MTRDAEHTPSPQSVVVPVELMTLSLKAAEQFIVNGVETGYVRLPDYDDDPAHSTLPLIRDALALLSVAPAPSSLAGVEVSALRAAYDRWVHEDAEAVEVIERVGVFLAALSPEAPAREDEAKTEAWNDFEGDHLTDGNGYATAEVYRLCSEAFDAAWPQGRTVAIEAAVSAFLSNHEAPAEGAGSMPRCAKCGAGPLGNCGYYGCETPRNTCPLRARSSAPEAREGDRPHCQLCGGTVEGWFCQTCEASFEEVDGLLVLKSEAAHPAAPSADKLRIASAALAPFGALAPCEETCGVNMNDPLSKWLTIADLVGADQALAALKAEGA